MQFNTDNAPADIRNAMSVGSDPDGGYLVPDEMSMEMEKRLFETSPMRQIARVMSISANAWEAPYKSSDATSGGWVGEKAARTATATPTVGMQRIQTFEQYAYPEVTQTMLDDAAIPIEAFIVDETEDVMGRTENTAFVTGNGILRPRGFADYASAAVTTNDATRSWGVLQYVASGAAGAFSGTDKLITMMSKLNPNYRQGAVWTMNRSTEATVRQLKDGDGRYLVGFGDLRDSPFNFSLLGTEIVNLEDMADIASNSYSLAYGNFKRGYLIIDRTGFRVLRDPYTNKPYVGFYITKRVGGDVRNFDAIKLMKFAAS
jgi:HK97 family phage major capsid protein